MRAGSTILPAADPESGGPQARIEHEEFRRGALPDGAPPVTPRAAATVVVARPAAAGFEVLLLERPTSSTFAAGAFVFPGGAVDPDDSAAAWEGRVPETGERAACVAALRELFEETGILPAPAGRGVAAADLAEARRELLADRAAFSALAQRFGLDFAAARVAYFSRWITPRSLATRFDTRFFLLALGEGEDVEVRLTGEHDSARWEAPGGALARLAAGELPMLFPTRKTLERLAGFEALDEAFAALGALTVQPILAKLDLRSERVRPLMPGDPGYNEAY